MATTEEQVNWNLNQEIANQIAYMLTTARGLFLKGHYIECYFVFYELRLQINHHLRKAEKRIADIYEDKINKIEIQIKSANINNSEEDEFEYDGSNKQNLLKTKLILLRNERILLIKKYRMYVLKLLDEYGYLMERKKDSTQIY